MKALKIKDILKATGGTLLCGDTDKEIKKISTDSRKTDAESLFIPLRGEKFDGHDFLPAVLEKGVACVLKSKGEVPDNRGNTAVIAVENTLFALGKIAQFYRSMFKIPAVAITGSVGKTTTKEMCALVLSQKYKILKNKGNFNNEIGVPLTVFELDDLHDILISEMGMSGFGEIDRLSDIVRPEIVIMTNIGLSHIEFLGSQENIYKAKSEFVKNMNPKGVVIINGDDKILWSHRNDLVEHVIAVGIENPECDILAKNVVSKKDSLSFTVEGMGECFDVVIPTEGEHNVYNALSAVALGMLCHVETGAIQRAFSEFVPDGMRLCVINCERYTVINDCYNAAPDSMAAALKVLGAKETRKVAVLGDIACLGNYSYQAHKNVGADVVKNNTDVLITIGKEARLIAESAFEHGMESDRIYSFDTTDDALLKIGSIIEKNDTILVKASRVMMLEKITEFLTK